MDRRFLFLSVSCLFLSACWSTGENSIGTYEYTYTIPTGSIEDPEYGKEVWLAIGPMMGLAGTQANGAVQAHYFEKGVLKVTVQVNIEKAPEGNVYVAWLKKEGGSPQDMVKLGQMETPYEDVRHTGNFPIAQDLRDLKKVVITVQKPGSAAPGTPVAEGTMKEVQRPS